MPIGSIYSRAELRQRLRDEVLLATSSGAASDERLNRSLQVAINGVWDILIRSDQGIGVTTESLTIATGDPDGIVPGPSIPLPSDFRRLLDLRISNDQVERTTPSEMFRRRQDAAPSSRRTYYVGGPTQGPVDPTTGIAAAVGATLETHPDLVDGDTIVMLYSTQPPDLGDPADPAQDVRTVDLLHDPVARYVVARAGMRALSRDDQEGRSRLAAEAAMAQAEFDPARAVRAGGIRRLSDYGRRGR
jgi:hypothetical protein